MRKLLFLLLVFPVVSQSQIFSIVRNDSVFVSTNGVESFVALRVKPITTNDTSALKANLLRKTEAAALYQPVGSYLTTATANGLYQPIGTYLRPVDSAAMLSPYLRSFTATTLYQPLNTTVKITDSASMLSKYLRIWDATTLYQPKGNYQPAGSYVGVSDTASMLNKYLRVNVAAATYQPLGNYQSAGSYVTTSDTALMLSKYLRAWDASTLYQLKGTYLTANPNIGTATGTSLSVTGSIGYGAGAGGIVTQATNKATAVTLNKITGEITLNAAALAAGAIVSFTLTNSTIANTDIMALNHVKVGTRGAYNITADCLNGSAIIYIRNTSAASLAEAIVIRFAVIKGAIN